MMLINTLGRTELSVGNAPVGDAGAKAGRGQRGQLGRGDVQLGRGIYALEGAIWRNFSSIESAKPCLILLILGIASFLLDVYILSRQQE